MKTSGSPAREYFLLALSSIGISVGFAHLFLVSKLPSFATGAMSGSLRETGLAVVLALLGLSGTTIFYTLLVRKRQFEARLVLAAVMAPTVGVVVVVVSQTILLTVLKQTNALAIALVIMFSLYLSVFSAIFVISGWASRATRNIIYVVYGSVLGGFIGIGLTSLTLLVILMMIALYDLLVASYGLVPNLIENVSRGSGVQKLAYKSGVLEAGVGDFIFNSCLPAHVYTHFGIGMLMWTILLVLAGYAISFLVALKRGYAGGISAPVFLGVIPILLRLVSSAF